MVYHSLREGLTEVRDEKRPSSGVCDCRCGCHDNGYSKASGSVHILGSTNNSVDLWVSTPTDTKWIFVDEEEVKKKEYYDKLRKQNRKLCG